MQVTVVQEDGCTQGVLPRPGTPPYYTSRVHLLHPQYRLAPTWLTGAAAVYRKDSLGSDPPESLGEVTREDYPAQSRHAPSGIPPESYTRARSKNGRCLDSAASKWAIYRPGLDSGGGSLNTRFTVGRRSGPPESSLLLSLSTLRVTPVQTHLESHFANVLDPSREQNNQDSSIPRVIFLPEPGPRQA